ncbi:MAG: alpha/beta hydrolase [Caulobacter sp.]|nr:alpha/beta hydrolase [Caulobacter sp.]
MLIFILFAQLAAAGAIQSQGRSLDLRLSAPTFVDLGAGRRLNFFCIGQGSPTVIFEQGGEGDIANWKAVQPAISALTRTCFYDRAGFGYSDPPDKAVTALNVTDDFRALLQAENIQGPVILVGHSIGGFYATVYASRFPADVAGLVLVDPGFSGQELWQTPEDRQLGLPQIQRGEQGLLDCATLARAGGLSQETLRDRGCFPVSDQLPPGETRYLLYAVTRPNWYEAEYSQSLNFFSRDENLSVSQSQETAVHRPFGDLPLEVLSAATPPASSWLDADRSRVHGQHWQDGHRRLAERSTQGRWAIVQDAGHFIQLDQPQAVIASIERVIAQVRAMNAE